jgi:hypothetical protein
MEPKMNKIVHNVQTNKIEVVSLSDEEASKLAKHHTESAAKQAEIESAYLTELEKLNNARKSVLEKLGITEDEARLLLS